MTAKARELNLLSPVLIIGTQKEANEIAQRLIEIVKEAGGVTYNSFRQLDVENNWAIDFGFTNAQSYHSYLDMARKTGIMQ